MSLTTVIPAFAGIHLKNNGTNLSVIAPWLAGMCPLPCDSRGGLGWGASAASSKSLTLSHGFLLSEDMATFGCTLKDKQPHPNPPLLSQGRGASLQASAYTLKLVPLILRMQKEPMDSRFRGNDDRMGWSGATDVCTASAHQK